MHQTAYMSLRKPCQRFRFLFYLPLPRIPARMVLFYRLYIYLCPAILNALAVISGSHFFGQHYFPEKSAACRPDPEDLPVIFFSLPDGNARRVHGRNRRQVI